jgi:hypothetical protein
MDEPRTIGDDETRYVDRQANDLDGFDAVFDPTLAVDPTSRFYVPRQDYKLARLADRLKKNRSAAFHAFLCGHRGSGKTTELLRLCGDREIAERYTSVFVTAQSFGTETTALTHDALMVEIGLALVETGRAHGLDPQLEEALDRWGREVVKTFAHDESIGGEAGLAGFAWLAFFKAQLQSRRRWEREETQRLEPKIDDLVDILNRMAADLREKTGKQLLVIVDDLEKGETDAHQAMHRRIFQDNYETLVQPRMAIVYTVPIYFRSLPGSRIPNDQLYPFSALRLYRQAEKSKARPSLATESAGYSVMRDFVLRRIAEPDRFFDDAVLDELLLIGGGLFRDTARAFEEAAFVARTRGSERIEVEDAQRVFHLVKKEYQPMVRGPSVRVLKSVLAAPTSWVVGVEPYLQSRAVVEYENDDVWLDLRYPLKQFVADLPDDG